MPLKSFDEYVALAEVAHGHMCAGQILGLRLAIYGVKLLGIDDPAGKDRKCLVSFVEIDRCATDAVPIVTGCRLGKRALKFRDFGKVAATFCDSTSPRSTRTVAFNFAGISKWGSGLPALARSRISWNVWPDPARTKKISSDSPCTCAGVGISPGPISRRCTPQR